MKNAISVWMCQIIAVRCRKRNIGAISGIFRTLLNSYLTLIHVSTCLVLYGKVPYTILQANPDYKGVCHVALAQEGHCRPGEVNSVYGRFPLTLKFLLAVNSSKIYQFVPRFCWGQIPTHVMPEHLVNLLLVSVLLMQVLSWALESFF